MIATSCPRTRSDGSNMIRCGLGKTFRLPTPLWARLLWTGHPAPNGINAIKYQIQRVNGGILVATNHKKRYQEVAEPQRTCPEAQLLANNIGTKSTFDAKPLHSSFTLQKCFIHNLARFNKKAQLLGFRILMILGHHLAQPYSALQLSCLMGQLVKVHPLPSPPSISVLQCANRTLLFKVIHHVTWDTRILLSLRDMRRVCSKLTLYISDRIHQGSSWIHCRFRAWAYTVMWVMWNRPWFSGTHWNRETFFQKCFHSPRAWPMESATNSAAWHFQQRR